MDDEIVILFPPSTISQFSWTNRTPRRVGQRPTISMSVIDEFCRLFRKHFAKSLDSQPLAYQLSAVEHASQNSIDTDRQTSASFVGKPRHLEFFVKICRSPTINRQ
jgi:hypothetical protein